MKTIKIFITGLIITVLLGSWVNMVIEDYKIESENSTITIKGTSSLHDWEMNLEKMNVNLSINKTSPALVIEKAVFSGETKSLSSESSLMDKKAWGALKVDKHPQIKFVLKTPHKVEMNNGVFKGTASGALTIAGVTKNVSFPFTGTTNNKNEIILTGSENIDMTEFGIEPPTAMLGSLKTGKDITVSFSVNLKQQ